MSDRPGRDTVPPAHDAQLFREAATLGALALRRLGEPDERVTWQLAFAVLLAALAVARAAILPGVPAFQHDWMWPTSHAGALGWLHLATSAWVWEGTGAPQIYPFAQFVVSFESLAALAFGTKPTLIAVLFVTVALAASGAMRAAAACGVRRRAALAAAGAAYALSPVFYNKLCAGHTYYLLALALFPWIFAYLWRERAATPRAIAVVALLCALSWSQAQFIVFDLVLLGAFVVLRRDRRVLLICGAGLALAVAVQLYSFVALLHPAAGSELQHQTSNLAGVATESVDLWSLLRQDGYPPGYFRTVTHDAAANLGVAWSGALILGVAGILGLLAGLRARRAARGPIAHVAAIGIVGAVIVAGFNPPFGALVEWIFAHLTAASILKELYHAMVMVSFAYAVGVALLIDVALGAAAAGDRRIAATAVALALATGCAVIATALPMLLGSFAFQVEFHDGTPLDALVGRATAGLPEPGRIAMLPITPPLRSFARAGGGQDSERLRPWQWSSSYSGEPDPQLAYLETASEYGATVPLAAVAKRLGVAAFVFRKSLHSTALESAGEPDGAAFDYPAVRRVLDANGLAPAVNDDGFELWPVPSYAGVVLAGPAPLSTSSDTGAVDRFETRDVRPRGTYVPARYVEPFAGGSTTPIAIFALAQHFNAHDGWTPSQFTYFVNRWQNNAPEGTIFSFVPETLRFDVARGARVLFARLASIDAARASATLSADGGAFHAVPVTPLERVVREEFTWYAIALPARTAHVALRFAVPPNGLALAQLRSGARATAFRAVPLPRNVADVAARAFVTSAVPTALTALVTSRGTGTCSATLLTAYDAGWSAREAGGTMPLPHFRADGWANGYLVPCGGSRRVTFRYDARFFDATALAGRLLLLVLAALAAWYESAPQRARLRRRPGAA